MNGQQQVIYKAVSFEVYHKPAGYNSEFFDRRCGWVVKVDDTTVKWPLFETETSAITAAKQWIDKQNKGNNIMNYTEDEFGSLDVCTDFGVTAIFNRDWVCENDTWEHKYYFQFGGELHQFKNKQAALDGLETLINCRSK